MRADRMLSILLLLQLYGRLTARELAQRLEISERTIQRDMEALSAAGVLVVAERGQGGGWYLVDGYETKLTGLKAEEIQALFLANPARLLQDLGLNRAAEAAMLKLLVALPSLQRQVAESMQQRIHIDVTGWRPAKEDASCLSTILQAIWQERKLRVTYRRGDSKLVERLLEPLGVVAKGSIWYLVAVADEDIRTYRVSRLQHAVVTDEPFTRPDAFDLANYWEESKARFVAELPQYPVTLHVETAFVSRLHAAGRFSRVEHIESARAAGWHRVSMQFETEEDACACILSFGPQVEVIAPDTLRQQIPELARQILALY